MINRRTFLSGVAAASLLPEFGQATQVDGALSPTTTGTQSGFWLADIADGRELSARNGTWGAPPASVLKMVTALYALEALGEAYRFETRITATGEIREGVLHGDLALVGDGDPVLDTNALRGMARKLREAGITSVNGRFFLIAGALPHIEMVNQGQPEHAGYNPAISGLNLDFNRVRLDWVLNDATPVLNFKAKGRDFDLPVARITGEIGQSRPPRHRYQDNLEVWELSSERLRRPGGVWLPVRRPVEYAGEVFRGVAALEGVTLPKPQTLGELSGGQEVVRHESSDLNTIVRGMLRYSTNLTAEVLGLRASQALAGQPETLAQSAASMTEWARASYGIEHASFVDHSGLSDKSRWSPQETVDVLLAEQDRLPHLLPAKGIAEGQGGASSQRNLRVLAKSGTLYFASGLAGYVLHKNRGLAFAIYSADPSKRANIRPEDPTAPPGSKSWIRSARAVQKDLLRSWSQTEMPAESFRPMPRTDPVKSR